MNSRHIVGRAAGPAETVIEGWLVVAAMVAVLTTVGILWVLASETLQFFGRVSFVDFLTDTAWTPLFADPHFGIGSLVAGTALTSSVAMILAVPLGVLSAIYLSELSTPSWRRVLKPAMEILAGVPTLVYGYFALLFVTPLLQRIVPDLAGFNALAPGLVMGVMITPMVASLSEDAIHAVPRPIREAAYGLGARQFPTIVRVVLPAARSGILASCLLAVGRALGETMIVTIAAGQQPRLTLDPRVPVETMTAYIAQISLGDTPSGTLEYQTIFAVGAALFALTFALNLLATTLTKRLAVRT